MSNAPPKVIEWHEAAIERLERQLEAVDARLKALEEKADEILRELHKSD